MDGFKITIGTEVLIPGSQYSGILRFVGQVKGKVGTFAGVELLGDHHIGKNNGDVDGIYYFHTSKPNTGLFLPYAKLVNSNIHLQQQNKTPIRKPSREVLRSAATTRNNSPRVQSMLPQPLSSSVDKSSPKLQGGAQSAPSSVITTDLERFNRQLLDKNKELKTKLTKYENELKERTINLFDLQKLLDELEKELDNKEKRYLKQKKNYDQQRDELRDAIKTLEEQLEENSRLYSEEITRLMNQRHHEEDYDLKRQYDAYIESTSRELLQFKTEIIESHKVIDFKEEEISKLKKLVQKIQDDKANVEKMIVDLEYQLQQRDEQIKELKQNLNSQNEIISQKEEEISKLNEQDKAKYEKEIDGLRLELSKLKTEDIDEDKLMDLKKQNETLSSKLSQLTIEHDTTIRQISQQHELDLQQKQSIINSLSKRILEMDNQTMPLDPRHLKDITNHHTPTSSPTTSELMFHPPPPPPFSTSSPLSESRHRHHHHHTPPPSAPSLLLLQNRQHTPSPKFQNKTVSRKRSSPQLLRKVASNITINENSISQLMDGELMVYIPETKTDPGAGREKWCGLCERQGHDSVDCEYF